MSFKKKNNGLENILRERKVRSRGEAGVVRKWSYCFHCYYSNQI